MTDWVARTVRGVIDFHLPGDPDRLPSAVFDARIREYYAQVRSQHGGPPAPSPPQDSPPAEVPHAAPPADPLPPVLARPMPSPAVLAPDPGPIQSPTQGRLI